MKKFFPLTAIAITAFFLPTGTSSPAQSQDFDVTPYYGEHFNSNDEGYVGFDPYYDGYYKDPYHNDGDYDWMYYEDTSLDRFDDGWMFYEDELLSPDIELRAQILSDLYRSPFVNGDQIQVSVNNGIATLSGTVEDRSAMIDAVEIAYDAGAIRVRNELAQREIDDRPWAEMRDRELKTEIEDELWWSPFVNEDRIRVDVQNGVAVMHGTVENRGEIADAVENAYEAGAKRVRSRLWVNPDVS